MAKKTKEHTGDLIIDRLLLVGILLGATSYAVKGTWAGVFLEAGALVVGIIWSARAVATNPSQTFRLLASLIIVLITALLAFYIAAAYGLLNQVAA